MKVAYITNSAVRSGVGYRAVKVKESIREMTEAIKLYDFHLDGKRGLLSKEGRPIAWVGTKGPIRKNKSVNWIRLGRRLRKYIQMRNRQQYDLWHVTNQSLSFLAKNTQPVVVTVHDIIELTNPQNKWARYLNRYLLGGIKSAGHVIAVSQYTAGQIKEYFGLTDDRVTVIYNGAGEEWHPIDNFLKTVGYQGLKKKWGIGEQPKVLLFVGSDHPRKKAMEAIEVLAGLIKEGEDVVLLKVGAAGMLAERDKLLQKIDQLGMRSRVKFIGDMSNDELNEIYNLSDLLLFPSTNEGFGLPLVQAMAAGLPIVAVRATATPEIVNKAALLSKAGEVGGMVRSVRDVIKNEGLRNRLIELGRDRAKSFSWTKSAQQVVEVYQTLTSRTL